MGDGVEVEKFEIVTGRPQVREPLHRKAIVQAGPDFSQLHPGQSQPLESRPIFSFSSNSDRVSTHPKHLAIFCRANVCRS